MGPARRAFPRDPGALRSCSLDPRRCRARRSAPSRQGAASPHLPRPRLWVRFAKPVRPSVLRQLETERPPCAGTGLALGTRRATGRATLSSPERPCPTPLAHPPPPMPGWDPRPQPRPDSSASRAAAGGPWSLVAAGSGRSRTPSAGCWGCGGGSGDASQGSRVPLGADPLRARSLGRRVTRALGSTLPGAGAAR